MKPSLTDTLCTQCGLCCDGSLFADVELASRSEAARLEILGLDIDDDTDANLLLQPCAALRGTRCSIYAHRPQCCRTFECRLLQGAQAGALSVDRARECVAEAHRRIRRVKRLLAELGRKDARLPLKEQCAEVFAGQAAPDPETRRKQALLERAMSQVEKLLRERFL